MRDGNLPLVSIVIPVYNVKDYLDECLDSILAQTYKNLEIILVDDGSNDGCSVKCDQCNVNDSRVKVIHQDNSGLSAARNNGIKIATGDYITFVDSDDRVSHQYVELLLDACIRTESDIAICDKIMGSELHSSFKEYKSPQKITCVSSTECLKKWHSDNKKIETTAWGKIYKTCLFKDNNINYPVGRCFEDVATTHKVVSYAKKIAFINARLYYYYQRSGSIKNSMSEKKYYDMFDMFEERISFFVANGYEKAAYRLERKYLLNCIFWEIKSSSSEIKIFLRNRYISKYSDMKEKGFTLLDRSLFYVVLKKYEKNTLHRDN